MTTLLDTVKADVCNFLRENEKLLFNERDLQMNLAVYLKEQKHYDRVEVEYYLPTEMLPEYKKLVTRNERLYLDIVVAKEGKYLPIELKYKTKEVAVAMERFGEPFSEAGEGAAGALKSHGAQDLGRYDFWKDVKRLELVKSRFGNVAGGLAVFLTNDTTYKAKPKGLIENFSMAEGEPLPMEKHWSDATRPTAEGRPDFEVSKEYELRWQERQIGGIGFHYCVLAV
ncbi:MAG: hypothetical protein IAB08_09045 [Bacteroidetes bacterium]|uniref:Uncharacterized protein n=1 Tax=Candidatus Pullibacteroides excrementavium TaxID=2840905 RepID=A0A9D9DWF7_9BACT|nr:hypothetical protein [Candidatus Pullibacteroides excrementavium]